MTRLLVAAYILSILAVTCCGARDRAWDFRDCTSKAEAKDRAKTLAAIDFGSDEDAPPAYGRIKDLFEDWVQEYSMTFATVQAKQKALKTFRNNLKEVRDTNLDDSASWWASGNAYSHLTHEEFSQAYLMQQNSFEPAGLVETYSPPSPHRRQLRQTPSSVNWVTAGKVGPVRNQGACGSCWAFAATSAIESWYLLKFGGNATTLRLSEQQLTSCIYTNGCGGGSSYTAMRFVQSSNQTTNAIYPYVSGSTRVGGTCNASIVSSLQPGQFVKLGASPKSLTPTNTQATLINAVQMQPIVVYLNATSGFKSYAGGVFNATKDGCTAKINHAVVAVGYDMTNATQKYWLIRNSWGSWGEKGYIRMLMTGDGVGPCGLHQYMYIPGVAFNSTTRITGV